MEYFVIVISAIFVSNIVLSQFLGICPFLGVSNKVSTAVGMSAAVVFVIALATIVTWVVQIYILVPLKIDFLQTISFILIIAFLVQMVEIILKKISPPLYQALGIYLPLITTNCAVLGVALLVHTKEYNLMESVVFGTSIAVGFGFAITLFAGIREHTELMGTPKGMKGVPIALVTAGILSLAFMGFSGLVK
jgi:electron transport complex protein RnfA